MAPYFLPMADRLEKCRLVQSEHCQSMKTMNLLINVVNECVADVFKILIFNYLQYLGQILFMLFSSFHL